MNAKLFQPEKTPLEGIHLIEASAGTGKTYTISLLVLRIILERGLSISEILVVTFTEAATAELANRVELFIRQARDYVDAKLTNQAISTEIEDPVREIVDACEDLAAAKNVLEEAVLRMDEAPIFTIHGFCSKVLADHAFETGASFSMEMLIDPSDLIETITMDFWRTSVLTLEHPFLINIAKEKLKIHNLTTKLKKILNYPKIPLQRQDCNTENVVKVWDALKKEWNDHEEEIKKIIKESLSLNRKSFGLTKLDAYFEELKQSLNNDVFSQKSIGRFTQSKIESATKKGCNPETHRFFELCDEIMNLPEKWLLKMTGDFLDYGLRELKVRKGKLGKRGFDDLLIEVHEALKGKFADKLQNSLDQKYQAALIDEFQDTDSLQYGIFSTLFDKPNKIFFMIGDPKQAIYRFRGGDINTFLKAKKRALGKESVYTLTSNYRSQPNLISALNLIFNIDDPFLTNGIDYERIESQIEPSPLTKDGQVPPPFVILASEKDTDKTELVAAEIKSLLSSKVRLRNRPLLPSDIAILVKSNGKARDFKKTLVKHGIKAVISKGRSVLTGITARHLHILLKSIVEPSEETLRAALISMFFNRTPADIKNLENEEKLLTLLESVYRAFKNWSNRGIVFALEKFFEENRIYPRLIRLPEGDRILTDLRHLVEILHNEEQSVGYMPLRLFAIFEDRLAHPDSDEEENEQRLESDEDAVNIITIHKSKGLEYPVVFVHNFGFSSKSLSKYGIVAYEGDSDKFICELRHDKQPEASESEKLEILAENRRLYYVALTRAAYRVYSIYVPEKENAKEPSAVVPFLKPWVEGIKDAEDVEVRKITANDVKMQKNVYHETQKQGEARLFKGVKDIIPAWGIESYSSLVKSGGHGVARSFEGEPEGIFAFPRGARPGEALHEIFEKLDYKVFPSEKGMALIQDTLQNYHIEGSVEDVAGMVARVLAVRLGESDSFCLGELSGADRIHELEFYLRAKTLYTAGIESLMEEEGILLKDNVIPGFLKGYIDLFFRINGKYYLVDWKSNHLGNSFDCYNSDSLKTAMREHQYGFQLAVYTVAMKRFLQNRLPDFDYNRDFGGAYYIFLRGVSDDATARTGIYYKKPDSDFITKLENYLDGGIRE